MVDLRALQPGYKAHFGRGIGRVVQELALRLPRVAENLRLVGLIQTGLPKPDPSIAGDFPLIEIKLPWPRAKVLDRLPGQELVLPLVTARQGGLTHFMAHLDGPAWGGGPTVVTVHDLILARRAGELAGGGWARRLLRNLEARAARRALAVVTVSTVTAKEVTEHLGVNPDKIRIIPSAAGEQFRPIADKVVLEEVKRTYDLTDDFILTVGGFDPRKNLSRLVRAWKRIPEPIRVGKQLALVGSLDDNAQVRLVKEEIAEQGLGESVRLLGRVGDSELPQLYNLATALVFPSFYEGFGLPALEAMSCGCPVLAARISALPEVVGEAGLYFDPAETNEITQALETALTNQPLMAELKGKGLKRAGLFTWDRAASSLAHVYRDVLAELD